MIKSTLVVKNRAGLHTRPSASLVKLASKYEADVQLIRDGFSINAKSIIGVMTLAAEQGCELILVVEGEDEVNAHADILELFESGFGEI